MSVRVYLGWVNRGGKTHSECGGYHSTSWESRLTKTGKGSKLQPSSLCFLLGMQRAYLSPVLALRCPSVTDCALKL